ncbi:stage II sporulation protein M [Parafilimonas sp.]|uniref:stage II sporulation protein M n=1 Tax=Parafilimonas sp. TaxID=1969739 RepID=UPI0039E3BC22
MREALFIKRNRNRWRQIQDNPSDHPDEMAQEFIQLVEDLGYSRTFYPVSKTTLYLNGMAAKKYLAIYQNKKESGNRVIHFFRRALPLIIAKHHRVLLISFCLFVLFVAIGFFSAKNDEAFVRRILGDEYVDMTLQNIKDGHPFGVYGYGNAFLSFLFIFINNVKVSLYEFGGGILFGYLTVISLVQNSVMVGAFEYLFYNNGLLQDSLLTIMIHGALELSTFVIAAASGLVLAKSWLFPGTVSRIHALKQGAKEGLIIALSNIPMLFIAAFFEAFLTRHADLPLWLKLCIITLSLAIVVGYFIVYPIRLRRKLNAVHF